MNYCQVYVPFLQPCQYDYINMSPMYVQKIERWQCGIFKYKLSLYIGCRCHYNVRFFSNETAWRESKYVLYSGITTARLCQYRITTRGKPSSLPHMFFKWNEENFSCHNISKLQAKTYVYMYLCTYVCVCIVTMKACICTYVYAYVYACICICVCTVCMYIHSIYVCISSINVSLVDTLETLEYSVPSEHIQHTIWPKVYAHLTSQKCKFSPLCCYKLSLFWEGFPVDFVPMGICSIIHKILVRPGIDVECGGLALWEWRTRRPIGNNQMKNCWINRIICVWQM